MTKKWLIKTPNKMYNGITEGVAFVNGQAIVEDEILKNMLVNNYGYVAEEIVEKKEEKPAEKKLKK